MRQRDPAWKADAACLIEREEDLWPYFFSKKLSERRLARNLCFTCPVRKECLTEALEHEEIWGVWGGCDENELRRALSLDANGDYIKRSRFPHCPYCKRPPSNLYTVAYCELATGRVKESVQCEACDFSWTARGSVLAVRAYKRSKNRAAKEKQKAARAANR